MRRFLILLIALLTIMALAPGALAGEGGKPAAHELEGKAWGKAVSDLARSAPGAVADHIEDRRGDVGEPEDAPDVETVEDVEEREGDEPKGNAYGWRIKNAFGMPYGLLLNDYKAAFDDPGYVGPHGETEPLPVVGAKDFWLAHGMLL